MYTAVRSGVLRVLHVSSAAAVNHLAAQVNRSEDDPMPPLEEYEGSYDIFKRQSEEIVARMCLRHDIPYTNLRIGAVYSESPMCAQCGALAILSRAGCSIPTPIDGNSGLNVAVAIHAIMNRMKNADAIDELYYYTRPTVAAAPYGSHLRDFMRANDIRFGIYVPFWLVILVMRILHWFIRFTPFLSHPALLSIDYVLQVNTHEHSFDNSHFRNSFPEVKQEEESIYECFVRRRKILENRGLEKEKQPIKATTVTVASTTTPTKTTKKPTKSPTKHGRKGTPTKSTRKSRRMTGVS